MTFETTQHERKKMRHIHPEYFKKKLDLLGEAERSLVIEWDQVVIGMELILDFRMPLDGGEDKSGTVRVPYYLSSRQQQSSPSLSFKEFRKSQCLLLEGISITVWVEL